MRAVDTKTGMARDFCTIGYGEKDPDMDIVEITLEDDDEISFCFDNTCLVIPVDRIRTLLGAK